MFIPGFKKLSVLMLCLASYPAYAGLIGATVTISRSDPPTTNALESITAVVPADGSNVAVFSFLDVSFPTANTISVLLPALLGNPDFALNVAVQNWGAGGAQNITGVTASFDPSLVLNTPIVTSFTSQSVTLTAVAPQTNGQLLAGVNFLLTLALQPVTQATPEPGTFVLMGLASVVSMAVLRRKV